MTYQSGFLRSASRASWATLQLLRYCLSLLAVSIISAPACFAALSQPTPDPNSIVGIGAVLSSVSSKYPAIVHIVKGGPADNDGQLQVNDQIAGVAQGNGQFTSCLNMPVGEAVEMIRGEKGSTVRLQIIPGGVADPKKAKIISLVRAEIKEANFVNQQGGVIINGQGNVIIGGQVIQGRGLVIIPGANGAVQIQPGPGPVPVPFPPAQRSGPAPAATPAPANDSDSSPPSPPAAAASPAPVDEAGIGVTIVGGRNYPVVARILPGGPAQRDGHLKVNDRILGVSQGDAPFTDCKDMPLPQVENLLHGPKDSKVRLQITPAGGTDPAKRDVVPLTRGIEQQPAR